MIEALVDADPDADTLTEDVSVDLELSSIIGEGEAETLGVNDPVGVAVLLGGVCVATADMVAVGVAAFCGCCGT